MRVEYELGTLTDAPEGFIKDNLETVVGNVFNYAVTFLVILGVGLIIYSGYKFMTTQGEANKIKEAQNTLMYVVIGLVIVLVAGVIADFIVSKFTGKHLVDYVLP